MNTKTPKAETVSICHPSVIPQQRYQLQLAHNTYIHFKARLAHANRTGNRSLAGHLLGQVKYAKRELRKQARMLHAFMLLLGYTKVQIKA